MQTQFTKEGITSYMILPWDGIWEDNYQSRLFQFHAVPGFLQYEVRRLDGEISLYYRLPYHTRLADITDHVPVTYEKACNMLMSMTEALDMVEEYFLEPEGIVWDSNHIFIDVATGKLQFCYYPETGKKQGSIRSVVAEIVQKVDKNQEDIISLFMEFYDLATEERLTNQALEYLKEKIKRGYIGPEEWTKSREETESRMTEWMNEVDNKEEKNSVKKEKMSVRKILGDAVLCSVGIADLILLCGFVMNWISLNYMGYLFVGMVVLIILIIIRMKPEEDTPDQIMQDYFATMAETSMLTEQTSKLPVQEHQEEPLRLEAMEKERYPTITLQKGSAVIGSMEEGCSYVLKERGVSRLHAKIMEKADGIYLLDLNSTNGTYLNGERIDAGQDYKLEKGDMVAFAKCEFYVV